MLIKGGKVLDALAQCSTVAFDKTGTLTQGQLACTGMLSLDDHPFAPPHQQRGECRVCLLPARHRAPTDSLDRLAWTGCSIWADSLGVVCRPVYTRAMVAIELLIVESTEHAPLHR